MIIFDDKILWLRSAVAVAVVVVVVAVVVVVVVRKSETSLVVCVLFFLIDGRSLFFSFFSLGFHRNDCCTKFVLVSDSFIVFFSLYYSQNMQETHRWGQGGGAWVGGANTVDDGAISLSLSLSLSVGRWHCG